MKQESLPIITQDHAVQLQHKYDALAKAVRETSNCREILVRADKIYRELNGWQEAVGSVPIDVPDCPF